MNYQVTYTDASGRKRRVDVTHDNPLAAVDHVLAELAPKPGTKIRVRDERGACVYFPAFPKAERPERARRRKRKRRAAEAAEPVPTVVDLIDVETGRPRAFEPTGPLVTDQLELDAFLEQLVRGAT